MNMIRSLKTNPNLLEAAKQNIGPFVEALREEHPGDYSGFDEILSTISIKELDMEEKSRYDSKTNTLYMNVKNILEDGMDPDHLFYETLLGVCTKKDNFKEVFNNKPNGAEELFKGIGRMITLSVPVPDRGRKQPNVLQYYLVSILSKIVEPEILVSSYMNNTLIPIKARLRELGVTPTKVGRSDTPVDPFSFFIKAMEDNANPRLQNNHSFGLAQEILLDMYEQKMIHDLSTGEIDPRETRGEMDRFGSNLIRGKEELSIAAPGYSFSELRLDAKDIKARLRQVRANIEDISLSMLEPIEEVEERVRKAA